MASDEEVKAAEEREREVLKTGRFGTALDAEDNALDPENDAYIGVSEEYKNSAYGLNEPMRSEDEDQAALEQVAIDHEVEMTKLAETVSPRTGFSIDTVHPTEREKPQDVYIEGNRALMGAMVKAAQADAYKKGDEQEASDEKKSDSSPPPF